MSKVYSFFLPPKVSDFNFEYGEFAAGELGSLKPQSSIMPSSIKTFQIKTVVESPQFDTVAIYFRISGNPYTFSVTKQYLHDVPSEQAIEMIARDIAENYLPNSEAFRHVVKLALHEHLFNPAAEVALAEPTPNPVSEQSKHLPGMDARVTMPCDCQVYVETLVRLWRVVQHLNDHHRWTRERIADWLDELHDKGEVNIEFEPWGEEKEKETTYYTSPKYPVGEAKPAYTHFTISEDGDILKNITGA